MLPGCPTDADNTARKQLESSTALEAEDTRRRDTPLSSVIGFLSNGESTAVAWNKLRNATWPSQLAAFIDSPQSQFYSAKLI